VKIEKLVENKKWWKLKINFGNIQNNEEYMEKQKHMVRHYSRTTNFGFEIKSYLDCSLAPIHVMQFFLSVEWRLMEGSRRLVYFLRKHRMAMEAFGLGMIFQGARAKEEVRPTSLSF